MLAIKESVQVQRKTCRLCESHDVPLAMPMNSSPIGDAYVTKEELATPQESYPLSLHLCAQCGHLQLPTVIDPKILFGNYIYRTSTSHGLVEHFRRYAEEIKKEFNPKLNGLVIEIGSNDGTLLNFFKQDGMRVLGIDPAHAIAQEACSRGIETLPTFFTFELAKKIKLENGKADVIAANNVFAHVDDMQDLLKGIEHLLAPEGIFVFEASYLVDMIKKKVFDTIYHEHVCYHRIEPLEILFNRYNMNLFDVKIISTKGGSIRGFAKLKKSKRKVQSIVHELITLERDLELEKIETYQKLSADLNKIKNELKAQLSMLRLQKKSIIGYGASPSVTTLTYHFELGEYLNYIVDDNPIKQGRFSPGHHTPIFPSEVIYQKKPDYILILAWQYAEIIMKKHQKFLDAGGHFIIPLPAVKIK